MHIRKVPFVGMTGWAVNSIAEAVEGSSPFLPNLSINIQSYRHVSEIGIALCYGHNDYKFESCTCFRFIYLKTINHDI